MKKNELKKLTKNQALQNIDKLKKDLFNFRFQKINTQITNPSKIVLSLAIVFFVELTFDGLVN